MASAFLCTPRPPRQPPSLSLGPLGQSPPHYFMKLYTSFALCFLLVASPVQAAGSDDPLLDAKLAVVELSSRYREKHPELIEAKAKVDVLSKMLPAEPPASYAAHLQERLRDALQQEAELTAEYREKYPARITVAGKIKFLREELRRTEH